MAAVRQPPPTAEDPEWISRQDDSHRYELLDRVLHKESPSNPRRDRTLTRISSRLDTFTEQNGLGTVLTIHAPDSTGYSRAFSPDDTIDGAPVLPDFSAYVSHLY